MEQKDIDILSKDEAINALNKERQQCIDRINAIDTGIVKHIEEHYPGIAKQINTDVQARMKRDNLYKNGLKKRKNK